MDIQNLVVMFFQTILNCSEGMTIYALILCRESLMNGNYQNDGDAFICGTHYSPVKGISLSISYQGWKPVNADIKFKNSVAVSFEYKS